MCFICYGKGHTIIYALGYGAVAYAQALEDDGYDDLQHITGLDEQEIDEVLEEIGMKKGHRRTFKREWAKLQ